MTTIEQPQRLQKILSGAGIASRRKSEEYITSGRITVNGQRILQLGTKALPTDDIKVDGEKINIQPKIYIALHKPSGYLVTTPPSKRRTVFDLVRIPHRLFYVGRLDYETEGLLLLTNDGAFAQQMSHPRFEKEKTYLVTIQGRLSREDIETLGRGIKIKSIGLETQSSPLVHIWPVTVRVISEGKYSTYEFSIHEGRKNIIRRVIAHFGKEVDKLRRIRIGNLGLAGISPGKWRYLRPEEVEAMLKPTKINKPTPRPITTFVDEKEFRKTGFSRFGSKEQRRTKFTETDKRGTLQFERKQPHSYTEKQKYRTPSRNFQREERNEAPLQRFDRDTLQRNDSDRPARQFDRAPLRGRDKGRSEPLFKRHTREYNKERPFQEKKPFKFRKQTNPQTSPSEAPSSTPKTWGSREDYAAFKERRAQRPAKNRYSRRRRNA